METTLENVFFKIALQRAKKILGSKARLAEFIGKVAIRLTKVRWREIDRSAILGRFNTIIRLLKAYAQGKYKVIPWQALLLLTAAAAYFLMPIDFIPDLVPGLGLTDDLAVLAAVYKAVSTHIDAFTQWEQTQLPSELKVP